MNGPQWQPKCTTGRPWWLVIVVALGLALGSQTAMAKECHRETPLPADVHLSAPGPEVPEAMVRFAGVWSGAWLDRGREALCHTLVVEKMFDNGAAGVIYRIGTYEGWNIGLPNVWRATARIVNGALRFHLPVPDRPERAYRFAGENAAMPWPGWAPTSSRSTRKTPGTGGTSDASPATRRAIESRLSAPAHAGVWACGGGLHDGTEACGDLQHRCQRV